MAQTIDNYPVRKLDLDRYLGNWFEIARMDHSFERGISHAQALYTLKENGTITVMNSGIKNGRVKVSRGKAKLTDKVGLLRVSFFGPFYSDYRVLMVDENYQYALVGSKSENYLWILSRTPKLGEIPLSEVLHEAKSRGYSINELIWVEQDTLD